MHASVRALLSGILDYAGLFPPAKLPLEEALRNYLHYRKESPYRWMLGRFVCPTGRLQELLALAKAHPDGSLLSLTTLGTQSSQASEVVPRIQADVKAIEDFRRAWGNDAVIDTYEVALPSRTPVKSFATHIPQLEDRLKQSNLRCFIEIPLTGSWEYDWEQLAEISANRQAGAKMRCGGLTADAFPGDDKVGFLIAICREAYLPWKATAGLHHPRRFWDDSLKLWHHGFLNVFIAGLLGRVHALAVADIAPILADRTGEHFRFVDDRISWQGWSCTTAEIVKHRADSATSFGCCSFDEPIEGLIATGLLDRA